MRTPNISHPWMVGLLLLASWTALGQVSYYVDPNAMGASEGTSSSPWSSVSDGMWRTINNSLRTSDVTVYFSALDRDGKANLSTPWYVELNRSDLSTHRLTLDGYAFYRVHGADWEPNPSPINVAYTNHQIFELTGSRYGALGWSRQSRYKKQSNVTLRGFECSGPGARVSFEGDNDIVEYLYIHDLTHIGPGLAVLYTFKDRGVKSLTQQLMPPATNMVIRDNCIRDTFGEAIYIGSVNPDIPVALQQAAGNQHCGLEICSNLIHNPGTYGGQGDGIDCKNGISRLYIHDNDISGVNGMGGIILPQTMVPGNQECLIERNIIHDSRDTRDSRNAIYGLASSGKYGYDGVVVRNNLIYNFHHGCRFSGVDGVLTNISFYNNTVCGCDTPGLEMENAANSDVHNNLLISNNITQGYAKQAILSAQQGSSLRSDFNAYSHGPIPALDGPRSTILSPMAVAALFRGENTGSDVPRNVGATEISSALRRVAADKIP